MAHTEVFTINNWGTATPAARVKDSAGTNVGAELTAGYSLLNGHLQWTISVPDAAGYVDFYPSGSPTLPLARLSYGPPVPTAGENATAVMASTAADGTAFSTLVEEMRAGSVGVADVTDNGDGTVTVAFKKRDGSTTSVTRTFNPTTGDRT